MPKYRTESSPDLISAIDDIRKRLSKLERIQQTSTQIITSSVDAQQSTTTTTYTDLSTIGPSVTVNIGISSSCLVIITALISWGANEFGFFGVDITGATTISASEDSSLSMGGASAGTATVTASIPMTALNLGSNTFTAKYKSQLGTEVSFQYRRLTIVTV